MNSETSTVPVRPNSGPATVFTRSPFEVQICRVFLVLGALLGTCYAILVPPFQTPDEFAHLFRAYSLSDGYCVAPPLTQIPRMLEDVGMAFPPKVETQRRISAGDILKFLREPLRETPQRGVLNESINAYNCIPYAPAALAIRAGRLFAVPPAAILYLARLANLIFYLAVTYLSLRQLPDFHIGLFCVALMPMTLNQASSASWDAVVFSSAFFLCAYLARLIWDAGLKPLEVKHYVILGAAIVIASWCKTNVWLAPLILLVPVSRFRSVRRRWVVSLGCFLLALVVIAGWNYLNRENMASWSEHNRVQLQASFADNAAAVYQHPWMLLRAFGRTCADRWQSFAGEFVGRFGWLSVDLPVWAVWTYCTLLGFVALTGTAAIRMRIVQRLVILGVVVLAVASIFIAMWCANTPESYKEGVLRGVGHIPGVQGRYFIPFAFPLLLAFSNTRLRIRRWWLFAAAAVVVITVNAVALETIRSAFYLTACMSCGQAGPA